MQIARVVGTVVATRKHPTFEGAKLLLVQPVTLDDQPRGVPLLAVDAVGAGVHERVVIVIEGRAAGEALGRKGAPVDAAVIGIVDELDVTEDDSSGGNRVRAGAAGPAGTPSRPETRGPS